MVNYQNGKIYKIWSPSQDLQYIGSTAQELSQRLGGHKKNFKLFNNPEHKYNQYCTSYEVLKYEDYRIDLLENYSCNSKSELNKKEGEYIRNNVCVNKVIPGRTEKQYREDNKDKIFLQRKEYRKDNKEKIAKYKKEHYHDNRDKILEKQKQYRKNNKDNISQKSKERYKNNIDKIKEKQKEKYKNNKDKILKKQKQYKQDNKDKILKINKEYY